MEVQENQMDLMEEIRVWQQQSLSSLTKALDSQGKT